MYPIAFAGSAFYIILTLGLMLAGAGYATILGIRSVTKAKRPAWTEVKPKTSQTRRLPVFRDEAATGIAWETDREVHHNPKTGEIRGDHHLTAVLTGSSL